MMEKAKNMNYAEFRIPTYAEVRDRIMLTCAVYGIPENEHKYQKMPFLYEPKHGIDPAKLFDAEIAEIMDDRNAEKAKVRNRRRANRKHPENKAERKKNEMRKIHRLYGCVWEDGFGWSWEYKSGAKKVPEKEAEIFRNLKERSAEKVDLADWELESAEIAEDEMIARFNAELEEFDRKWREEAEAEQRRMREYRKLRDLHEWLKYA